jgi:FKBP-type peptidyl-prolyl cis-trans isomerase FkpA
MFARKHRSETSARLPRLAPFALGAVLVGAAIIGACSPMPVQRADESPRSEVTTNSGVKFQDIRIGTGPAAAVGDEVTFEYTAWLESGEQIDSTDDRGTPAKAVIGSARLKGWNDGLLGIQAQGRRRLVLPPDQAYGAQGVTGLVPPNATLVFDVRALQIGPPSK